MTSENNNRLDDALAKAIGSEKPDPDFAKWQQEHPEAMQMLKSQATQQPHPRRLPDIGRIIMKSPITKLAVAATIIVAVVVSVSVFNKSMPAAFGIEQVIAAYGNVHFLYLKYSWPNQQIESEFWIKSDEQGNVAKVRGDLRETGDGPKLFVWTPEKSECWFKRSNTLSVSGPSKAISPWQTILDRSQPKLLMKKLLEDQNEGKVDVDIQKPQDKQKPVLIIATYKNEQLKRIYYIDQATDLITRAERYKIEDNKEFLELAVQFSSEPIDENMFSIDKKVPKDVNVIKESNHNYGLSKGKMSNEQAAVETVGRFLQALIDKNYRNAAQLSGESEEKFKNEYVNVTKIISIGTPVLQSNWIEPSFKVPCEVEIINLDGQKTICRPNAYAGPNDSNTYTCGLTWIGYKDTVDGREYIADLLADPNCEKTTPKEAAEAFFKACSEKNWDEFAKFIPRLDNDDRMEQIKEYLGGLQVISIGEPFKRGEFPGWYVPYKVRFNNGLVQDWDLAIRNDNPAKRYVLDGGI
ncbi:MAG: hypothetical protein ABSF37_11540 [Sedimentisphaerales bacterium]|jgi:hypothetical protein